MTLENLEQLQLDFSNKISGIGTLGVPGVDSRLSELRNNADKFFQGGMDLLNGMDVLKIGVVGQMNTGKSSFLNALFFDGQEILPKAATPMTAGLTVLKYTEGDPYLDVEYFTKEEWKIFETYCDEYKAIKEEILKENPEASGATLNGLIKMKTTEVQRSAYEMDAMCDTPARRKIGSGIECVEFNEIGDLQNCLAEYVGARGKYTPVVKSITIHLNDERLKGVQIVDTPGVNDPVSSREMRTREFLRTCHGVFFLSFAAKFFDSTDKYFLENRIGKEGIGTVLMLASKFDALVLNLVLRFPNDLEGAVGEAVSTIRSVFDLHKAHLDCGDDFSIVSDFTSGIGYSIVKKDPSEWDEFERHTVEKMKEHFPNYFSKEKDFRDNFLFLANFDTIRDKYLEETFRGRKDEIIGQKIDGYFENNAQIVVSGLSDIISDLQKQIDILNNVHQKDIDAALKATNQFKSLSAAAMGIFNDFNSTLQNTVVHSKDRSKATGGLREVIPDFSASNVPILDKTLSVEYDGMVWGTNRSNFKVEGVDQLKLRTEVFNKIDVFANAIRDFWADLFKQCKDKMFDSFCNNFTTAAGHLHFMNDAFLLILKNVLSDIDQYAVLPIADDYTDQNGVVHKGVRTVKNELSISIDLCEQNVATKFNGHTKSEVPALLNHEYDNMRINLKKQIISYLDGVVTSAYNVANDQIRLVNDIITQLGGNIEIEIEKEKNKYLTDLKTAMESLPQTIKKYEDTIASLNDLKNNFLSYKD